MSKYKSQVYHKPAAPGAQPSEESGEGKAPAGGLRPGQSRAKDRPRRRPYASRKVLLVPKREGYHRHFFNDVGDNIARRLEEGYTIVEGDQSEVTDKTLEASQMGSQIVKRSNRKPVILMEKPEDWYQEDLQDRHQAMDKQDLQMKSAHKAGEGQLEGKLDISRGPVEVVDTY